MTYEEKLAEYKSRVSDPKVSLEIDGRGVPDEAADTGFIHWLTLVNTFGDDGKRYFMEFVNMTGIKEAGVDIWMLEVGSETGNVVSIPGSIYKVAKYPFIQAKRNMFPAGTLTMKKSEKEVTIDLPDARVVCKDDNTWHYSFDDKERKTKLEMVHYGVGYPTWYGREKPKHLTAHAIAYGYNWAGRVEGELTIDGRKVKLKGAGLRERYVALDQSAPEVGGWEDWMWFHFDEMFGSFWEMKYYGGRDMSLNIVEGNQFFPVGDFNIEHHDWAFHPQLGAFVPVRYRMTLEVEAGVLELGGNIVESKLWGMKGEVPDAPLYTHNFDKVNGVFTYKDGRKVTLTNGLGGGCVRLWKPYPNIFMPQTTDQQLQAYSDRVLLFE
ncbi:hypothetical protein ACFLW2_01075 [Chloroflexota bacterium]